MQKKFFRNFKKMKNHFAKKIKKKLFCQKISKKLFDPKKLKKNDFAKNSLKIEKNYFAKKKLRKIEENDLQKNCSEIFEKMKNYFAMKIF